MFSFSLFIRLLSQIRPIWSTNSALSAQHDHSPLLQGRISGCRSRGASKRSFALMMQERVNLLQFCFFFPTYLSHILPSFFSSSATRERDSYCVTLKSRLRRGPQESRFLLTHSRRSHAQERGAWEKDCRYPFTCGLKFGFFNRLKLIFFSFFPFLLFVVRQKKEIIGSR